MLKKNVVGRHFSRNFPSFKLLKIISQLHFLITFQPPNLAQKLVTPALPLDGWRETFGATTNRNFYLSRISYWRKGAREDVWTRPSLLTAARPILGAAETVAIASQLTILTRRMAMEMEKGRNGNAAPSMVSRSLWICRKSTLGLRLWKETSAKIFFHAEKKEGLWILLKV